LLRRSPYCIAEIAKHCFERSTYEERVILKKAWGFKEVSLLKE
jgi:hypothetical protein